MRASANLELTEEFDTHNRFINTLLHLGVSVAIGFVAIASAVSRKRGAGNRRSGSYFFLQDMHFAEARC